MHHTARQRRLAVVGIDGFAPAWIERCLDEGDMPHLAAVRLRGSTVPLLSTLPATTPVAWASIATGCHPATTGIEGFLVHRPGNRLDERVSGTYADRCKSEPVWETATLAGKRSCVVKFPLSYPSATATVRIDGAAGWGGLKCLHEIASTGVSDSARPVPQGGRFSPEPPTWAGDARRPLAWSARLELPALWQVPAVRFHVAITAEPEPQVVIAGRPDWTTVLATLPAGGWSEPLFVRALGRRGEAECALRFKVLEVAAGDAPHVRLLTTPVHETGGHSAPPERAARHLHAAGPIEEQTEPSLCLEGLIDVETQLERCRLNVDWLARVAASILAEPWDLFMIHVHVVDWAHHLLHGAIDPRHPAYDPAAAARAEELLRAHYRLADELVGAVVAALEPEDDVMVLGDHGQDLAHTTVRLNEVLAARGYLHWAGAQGEAVDWTRTRAYAAGNYVHLNLAGREPTGIVEPADAPALVDELVRVLLGLCDPRDGARPVLIAGPKSHFGWLGADGEGVGDVVLCFASGYHARNDRGEQFALTVPLAEFTSGHDHFWPLDPRIETRLFAAGPSFRRGRSGPRRSVVDVAPTICAVLGIEPPPEYQGAAISDILLEPRVGAPFPELV